MTDPIVFMPLLFIVYLFVVGIIDGFVDKLKAAHGSERLSNKNNIR